MNESSSMNPASSCSIHGRLLAARIFLLTGLAAVLAGGLLAAVIAHAPGRVLVWTIAYLVLVAGVVQCMLGLGQAWLSVRLPSPRLRMAEWVSFNAGNLGVVGGTLLTSTVLVGAGTTLFVVALGSFLAGVRGAGEGWMLHLFRAILAVTAVGACIGLLLSVFGVTR